MRGRGTANAAHLGNVRRQNVVRKGIRRFRLVLVTLGNRIQIHVQRPGGFLRG
jgi:hypothetical protein